MVLLGKVIYIATGMVIIYVVNKSNGEALLGCNVNALVIANPIPVNGYLLVMLRY